MSFPFVRTHPDSTQEGLYLGGRPEVLRRVLLTSSGGARRGSSALAARLSVVLSSLQSECRCSLALELSPEGSKSTLVSTQLRN